jgi:hypothetical protein
VVRQEVAGQFGITPDQVRPIEVEGLENEWPLPPDAGMPRRTARAAARRSITTEG